MTTQLMGLPDDLAVGDAGYMIRKSEFFTRNQSRPTSAGIAFMPHFTAASNVDHLARLCPDIGIQYIDPRDPEETVLEGIRRAKMLC